MRSALSPSNAASTNSGVNTARQLGQTACTFGAGDWHSGQCHANGSAACFGFGVFFGFGFDEIVVCGVGLGGTAVFSETAVFCTTGDFLTTGGFFTGGRGAFFFTGVGFAEAVGFACNLANAAFVRALLGLDRKSVV